MAQRFGAAGWLGLACVSLLVACTTLEERTEEHRRQLQSLASTTTVVSQAWISGHVRDTYAVTALEQTLALLGSVRSDLGSDPDVLRDQTGGELSRTAEELSRQLASLIAEIEHGDTAAVRRHLSSLPLARSEPR